MAISKTPVIGENINRNALKKTIDDTISGIEDQCKEALKEALIGITLDAAADPRIYSNKVIQLTAENSPGRVEGYNFMRVRQREFTSTDVEICCPDTGFCVWGRSLEEAQALWNKAVEKLETLKDCCKDPANHHKVITNGSFPIIRCTACGQRSVPMPI